MNNSNFKDCLDKGDVGEGIVDDYLRSNNYHIYKPEEGSHPIDRLAIKDNKVISYDVKTKPRRIKYADAGLDLTDWVHYTNINTITPTYIFIVDEVIGQIYYQSVSYLSNINTSITYCNGRTIKYPSIETAVNSITKYVVPVIYFPVEAFKKVRDLTNEEIKLLKDIK